MISSTYGLLKRNSGITNLRHYGNIYHFAYCLILICATQGLELSKVAGLPADLVQQATDVVAELDAQKQEREESQTLKLYERRKIVTKLRCTLQETLESTALNDRELLEFLSELQKSTLAVLLETLGDDENTAI